MRPKTIGVLGGAGPLAGAFLVERILRLAQTFYGCYRDGDFPKVILMSFPFSDMLSGSKNNVRIQTELNNCLDELQRSGAEILVIACNTLHAFLTKERDELVSLPETVTDSSALALASSTSLEFGLFSCVVPGPKTQEEIDAIILQILKGDDAAKRLSSLIRNAKESSIVLGCTEFSLIASKLRVPGKTIIDPLEIAAQITVQRSFQC